ncbi:MAG TPA: tetratricopeptide repeat protein, partial [Candidatus Binatia bacterium]|nr:tetratricopeptide repeat protein [Candidatus Binatia bacterium]
IDTSKLDAIARRTLDQQITEVKAHPKSGSAWGQLGTMLRAFGFPPQALACFAKAEELDPKNPRWPYFQSLLLTSESPDRAIDSLRRAVRLCGSEPEMPRLRLSKLLAEQGRWDEAEIELRQLLAAKPGFTPATLLLARRAQAGGNDSDAISLARRCTEDRRTARGAWSLLAILYGRAGDTAAASEATRNATALPEDTSPADAFETEASRLRRNPRELAIGTHDLLAAGRLDEAASNIDQITKEHPEFAEGWLLLGRLQILRNQAPAAEQSLRHFLQMEPRSTQGLFQFGTALLQQNRFPEAAEIFLKATEIQPDFGPAYFNRGFALARAGQSREAVPNFQQAIRHNPEHIESYLLLADLHRQLGEREQGLAVLSSGLAINPSDRRLQQLRALMSK